MADRMRRVNTLIQQQLGRILSSELELPSGCIITIAKVETSRDLHRARVGISVLPIEQVETVLKLIRTSKTSTGLTTARWTCSTAWPPGFQSSTC